MMTFEVSMKNLRKVIPALFLLIASPSFAGGSDTGHTGGGGTFVKSPYSAHLVFWDLFEVNPRIMDNDAGDTITLSAQGQEDHGQWVDYRHFKSYQFLQQRLDDWARRAPRFAQLMRENDAHRDLLVIGTDLSIQKILELDVPARTLPYGGLAVPGAYFNYTNAHILLDIKVWNRAGLQSQAAMLLHERLRELQLRFQLSNAFLQELVYDVVMMEPEHVRQFDEWRFAPVYDHPGTVPDAWPARDSRADPLPSAKSEIDFARGAGILGGWPVYQPPASGDHGCPPEFGGGKRPNGGSDSGHTGGQGCGPVTQ